MTNLEVTVAVLMATAILQCTIQLAGGDVRTNLTYHVADGAHQYFYGYRREGIELKEGEYDSGGTIMPKEVTIANGRLHKLALDANSFELTTCETSLSTADFYAEDDSKIKDVYYKEMAECVKQKLGAGHVLVFHHQVRNKERNNGRPNEIATSIQGYANGVHSDTHPESAEGAYAFIATQVDSEFRQGRYLYMNLWRNIDDTNPVLANPLAVLDQTSVTKGVDSEDYLESDFYGEDPNSGFRFTVKQYRLNQKNSDIHKWYYFPNMTKSEAILFKQWDSDPARETNLCFHTAFEDPTTPPGAPTRQSIEVRMMIFFPDHVPNTCPSQAKMMLFYAAMAVFILPQLYPIASALLGFGIAAAVAYLLYRCCGKKQHPSHKKSQ